VALIQGWLAAEPQLTAIAIVNRLGERHPEQFRQEAAFRNRGNREIFHEKQGGD
jgi:hypothetical protein